MTVISQTRHMKANGHYSPAIEYDGVIYVSGQFSVDPDTGERKYGTVEDETLQALTNIELVLKEAGSDRSRILQTTAYVCSMEDWDKVNDAYMQFFGAHKPVRIIVNAKELHFGFKVEIEAVAAV